MSNRLFKGMSPEMVQAMREQNSRYACLFALAVSALNANGGSVILLTDAVNQANAKGIKFLAIGEDLNEWTMPKGWSPEKGGGPIGVKCILDETPIQNIKAGEQGADS